MTNVSTAPVTRASLFAMMQAYKNTSLLRTGVQLGVFDQLAPGPRDAVQLGLDLGADPRGTRILMNALAALGLVGSDGEKYWLVPGVDRLLVRAEPEFVGDMVHVFASDWEWDALKHFTEAVRNGGTIVREHAETPEYEYWEDFASYVPVVAQPTADILADALQPWASDRARLDVLDVACGHGVYGFTIAQRFAQANVVSLDWKNVLPVAARHARRMGVAERTSSIPGDMFEVPLGGPYDLVLLTNVLHHFSEQRATELLARVGSVVKPDGRLGVVGFTTSDALPAEDPAPHLFSVLMLAWTADGEVHSESAYQRMFTASGFGAPAVAHVPGLPFRVLTAAPAARESASR